MGCYNVTMVTVSELSSNIFLIKSDVQVAAEELLKVPEIIKLIGRAKFDLKPGDHDIWILRLATGYESNSMRSYHAEG